MPPCCVPISPAANCAAWPSASSHWCVSSPRMELAVAAAAFVPFAVLAPHGLWSSLTGQLSRPLQIESLGAAIFTTFGHPRVISTHGSQNVAGHGAVAATFALLQIADARKTKFKMRREPFGFEWIT